MSRNSKGGGGGRGPVPNRWLHCPRKSEKVIAERFLAFKTPLSSAFDDQVPIECLFQPEMIFSYCKTIKLKLGLWIDLTNTKRFYDREVVEKHDTQYVKLQCRGHGETPSPEQTQAFIEIVDNFINERPFDIVAVHCTHGFNRTGFLIASYLVERLDYSIETALAIFAEARPPGIYKQDYIDELFRRYEDGEDGFQAPPMPDWCLEYDDSDAGNNAISNDISRKRKAHEMLAQQHSGGTQQQSNGGGGVEDDLYEDNQNEGEDNSKNGAEDVGNEAGVSNDGAGRKKKRRREIMIENATFMRGVPGVAQVTDKDILEELQHKVQDMCGWKKSGFPGAQPVSMDMKNLKRLHEIPYRVSWKADGTRYMMLINKRDEIYFFDRNYSCFQVENLSFVQAGNIKEHLKDTLLDGEMVIDKFNGQSIPRYLIYDIIKISNMSVGPLAFYPDRLRCIKVEIIDPRIEAIKEGVINRSIEPFSVRLKDFWGIHQSASLLGEKFAKSLLHEPDGLIFQPSALPYTAGVCPDVLKWKPFHMNSIDFKLKITVESGLGVLTQKVGLLYVGGCDHPFDRIKYTKALKDLDNKIIECSVNAHGKWEFMRERTDKILPNSYNTAQSVVESIRNPVTKEILLDYITKYGFRDDTDRMPPPQQRQPQQQQRPPPHQPTQQHQRQPHMQQQSTGAHHHNEQRQQEQQQH